MQKSRRKIVFLDRLCMLLQTNLFLFLLKDFWKHLSYCLLCFVKCLNLNLQSRSFITWHINKCCCCCCYQASNSRVWCVQLSEHFQTSCPYRPHTGPHAVPSQGLARPDCVFGKCQMVRLLDSFCNCWVLHRGTGKLWTKTATHSFCFENKMCLS